MGDEERVNLKEGDESEEGCDLPGGRLTGEDKKWDEMMLRVRGIVEVVRDIDMRKHSYL